MDSSVSVKSGICKIRLEFQCDTLQWTPAHKGIAGNEAAGQTAKDATLGAVSHHQTAKAPQPTTYKPISYQRSAQS